MFSDNRLSTLGAIVQSKKKRLKVIDKVFENGIISFLCVCVGTNEKKK